MPILVATDREVVVIDVERGTSAPAHGLSDRPTCLAADALVPGRAWCGTHRDGVFRSDDAGRSWRAVGLAGRLIMAIAASPVEPDVVWVGTEPSEVWRSMDAGTTWEQTSRLETLSSSSDMVFSAEAGHSSRALDRVPPARTRTTVGGNRGRRARIHARRRPHLARPRHRWSVGHPRARRSSQRTRYPARRCGRRILRERRRRRDVALTQHRSRRRLPAQRID